MSEFRIGDKVIQFVESEYSHHNFPGQIMTVSHVNSLNFGDHLGFVENGDEYAKHFAERFRLATPADYPIQGANADLMIVDEMAPDLGMKYDAGKMNWSVLLHGLAKPLASVAAVLNYGMQKYEVNSWQGVPDAHARYTEAFYRHIMYRADGEKYDKESGLPHLAHIICNGLFMLWFEFTQGITDDSHKFNPPPKKD